MMLNQADQVCAGKNFKKLKNYRHLNSKSVLLFLNFRTDVSFLTAERKKKKSKADEQFK